MKEGPGGPRQGAEVVLGAGMGGGGPWPGVPTPGLLPEQSHGPAHIPSRSRGRDPSFPAGGASGWFWGSAAGRAEAGLSRGTHQGGRLPARSPGQGHPIGRRRGVGPPTSTRHLHRAVLGFLRGRGLGRVMPGPRLGPLSSHQPPCCREHAPFAVPTWPPASPGEMLLPPHPGLRSPRCGSVVKTWPQASWAEVLSGKHSWCSGSGHGWLLRGAGPDRGCLRREGQGGARAESNGGPARQQGLVVLLDRVGWPWGARAAGAPGVCPLGRPDEGWLFAPSPQGRTVSGLGAACVPVHRKAQYGAGSGWPCPCGAGAHWENTPYLPA